MSKKNTYRQMMVFLDASTLDLGDVNLKPIMQLGDYHSRPYGPNRLDWSLFQDAEIVITNKVVLGESQFKKLPHLKLICVAATGVNNVDLEAARVRNIAVCNVAGYSTQTVVEHTIMLLLACSHRLIEHHQAVVQGHWVHSKSFALLQYPFQDIHSKTLGVIGHGHIGREVVKLAKLLGMKVLIGKLPGRKYPSDPIRTPLATLLKKSDFVSLHCPLTAQTQHLVNAKKLGLMKPTAYLLNLARGPIVAEGDLVKALKKGEIAGYATDTLDQEPMKPNHPFLKKAIRDKIILTPHIAWASQESRQRLIDEIAMNIQAFRQGKKRNRVEAG